jgi:histidinol phosphatase-like PHP family hydrolase
MALEAKRLGRSYLAVTDHSHYLREGRLEAQNRQLREYLRERQAFLARVRSLVADIQAEDRRLRERRGRA